ncbi:MAG: hypothetical protein AB7E95_14150 [Kiritimatiellales bacterium]
MKTLHQQIICLIVFGLFNVAFADTIAVENFEFYSIGMQLGAGGGDGGTGWSGIWGNNSGGPSANDIYVRDGADYGTFGKIMMVNGISSDSAWLSRRFAVGSLGSVPGQIVYLAFRAKNTNGGNREAGFRLMKDGDTQLILGQTAGQTSWRLWDVAEGAQNSNLPTTAESLIILKIELSGDSQGDTVTFWINPGLQTEEGENTPQKGQSFTSSNDLDAVTAVRFGTNGASSYGDDAKFWFDDIRIGTAWEDVVGRRPSLKLVILSSM